MSPALLSLRKAAIHGRIVADEDALEGRFRKNRLQRVGVLAAAENHHTHSFRQKRPDGIDAPTRFVRVHDGAHGEQLAQRFELRFPRPRKPIQQCVGLRLRELELPKEFQQNTDFVQGQTDDERQKRNGDRNFHAEFRARQHAVDARNFTVGPPKDVVHDSHGPAVFDPPDGTFPQRPTLRDIETLGQNEFDAIGGVDFFLSRQPSAPR